MATAEQILARNDDFPLRIQEPIHRGKVRSVYWLTPDDSARLIADRGYRVAPSAQLAVMIISDRISAFECIWRGEEGLDGVPHKGAALNAISQHWFARFADAGLAGNHIVDTPHPMVWIVQRAQPVMIEAIVRGYITGGIWRAYARGERTICGIPLPEGLAANAPLTLPLITPSTKGIMKGIDGVPEADDVNISRAHILENLTAFGFASAHDVDLYEKLLLDGYALIYAELEAMGKIFVDTKFEFGYVNDRDGQRRLIYIDEVGTPDSSRIWEASSYSQGKVVEHSKENFRQLLLRHVSDPDVLLNKSRMPERLSVAERTLLPASAMLEVSKAYVDVAERITGRPLPTIGDARDEIIDILATQYGLIA